MADKTLRINLLANTKGLTTGLNKAGAKLQAFGAKAKSIGSSMKAIQLPMILAGGAAVKMAVDFDKSMGKIQSLVGATNEEMAMLGDAAKQAALEMGISSNEAADALFFIKSAGLNGADAIDVLNASAKAAAIGLGETATVADAATSAMNAYGSESLSATDATDVLVAAVREGKLEASELAGSIGRVIPLASNMGIRFDEVGAAMAAMSRTGTNAAEAATQLRGIFTSILSPSKAAEDMLNALGTSSHELRKQMGEEGLLSTLQSLKTMFEGNADAQQTVFGNVRALSGVMDLLGKGLPTTIEIFGELERATGATNEAFEKTSNTASFKLQKSLNSVKTRLTDVGGTILNALLPHIEKLTNFIGNLFTAFQNLSPTMQGIVLALGGIALVLPTIISLVGTLSTVMGALLSPVGLVVAALAAVGYVIYQNWGAIKPMLVEFINYFISLYNESEGFRLVIYGIIAYIKSMWEMGKSAFTALWNIIKIVGQSIIKQFQAVGKVIKGVFTLDWNMIKEGFADGITNAMDAVEGVVGETVDHFKRSGEIVYNNVKEGIDKAKNAAPIELITEEDVDNAIDGVVDYVKQAGEKIGSIFSSGISDGIKGGGTTGGGGGTGTTGNGAAGGVQGAIQETTSLLEQMGLTADNVGQAVGYALTDAFYEALQGGNFLKTLTQIIGQMLKKLIATAAAALVLATIMKTIFPNTAFMGMEAGAVNFAGVFAGLGGAQFANGGIVSSPTLGLMGEYAGARSNPEVIAPLDKLKSMIGDRGAGNVNVTGEFRLQGQDLVVALQRANKQRNRLG
jgi:TP901 family phage tail tape measure protein